MAAVKIASAQIKRYRRKLLAPLVTANGEITERRGCIVAVTSDEGHTGFGEIPFPLFAENNQNDAALPDDHALMKASVETLIGKDIPSSLEDVEVDIEHLLPVMESCIYFGMETALCDLAAKIVGLPLSRWLAADPRSSVPVNYLLRRPVADWDALATIIHDRGYRAVKVKVAVGTVDDDIDFVGQLRKRLGDNIAIRLDANRGWDVDTAVTALDRLSEFDIDYVEEPLSQFDPNKLRQLAAKTTIPIALDESLVQISDIDDVVSREIAEVLILKPSIIGGLARTFDIIKRVSTHNYRCVITTNLETEIGTAALLHAAAAIPGDIVPCGLDTLRLFENADPMLTEVTDGAIAIPHESGLGIGEALWATL